MTIENEAEEISDDDFDRPDEPLKLVLFIRYCISQFHLIVFRRAGIYTADEITMITRDKLLRLQSLYMEEIQKLQQLYVKRKSFYAPLIRGEETSIGKQQSLLFKKNCFTNHNA